MKKHLLVILMLASLGCFGQQDIAVSVKMKTVDVLSPSNKVPDFTHLSHAKILPVGYAETKRTKVKNLPKPVFVIDGLVIDNDSVCRVDPNTIKSISIIKKEQAGIAGLLFKDYVIITTNFNKKETLEGLKEYEVIVFDAGYEAFLAIQKPIEFYSPFTLKARNAVMTSEWNTRCSLPSIYDSRIYESKVDYNSEIEYNMEVEYKLYMFFKYMEKKYNISLAGTML